MSCNRKALFILLIVVEFFCSKILHHKKIVRVRLFFIGISMPRWCWVDFVNQWLPQRVLFLQLKSLLLVTRCWSVCSTGQGLCHCSARPIQNPPDWEFRETNWEHPGGFNGNLTVISTKKGVFLTKLNFVLRIYPFLATRILVGWQKMIQRLNILDDDRQ